MKNGKRNMRCRSPKNVGDCFKDPPPTPPQGRKRPSPVPSTREGKFIKVIKLTLFVILPYFVRTTLPSHSAHPQGGRPSPDPSTREGRSIKVIKLTLFVILPYFVRTTLPCHSDDCREEESRLRFHRDPSSQSLCRDDNSPPLRRGRGRVFFRHLMNSPLRTAATRDGISRGLFERSEFRRPVSTVDG